MTDLARSLEPVRQALLADAEGQAASVRNRAEQEAAAIRAEADAAVAEAVRRAEDHARATLRIRADQSLEQARAEAHAAVLRARGEARRRLAGATREAAIALRGDPRYPELLDRLERLAIDQLGPSAVVQRDPEPSGGVIAEASGRRVDYTLDALAQRALGALGGEIAELW